MTARIVDYESRRRAVLAATINSYIKDALPVASEDIAEEFALSSATIRNIFAELEESGYLMQPHTSAGRVPTQKGYRYYVDFLLSQMELFAEEKARISNEYRREILRMEDILEKTSEIIAAITHYTGIVSFLEWHDRFIYNGISFIMEQPEFQNLQKMRLLIKMIEEKRFLIDVINRDFSGKVKVYIGEELECDEMSNCSIAVSYYSLKNKPAGKLAVLGPSRMEYRHIISTLEYMSEVVSEMVSRV